MCTRWLWPPIFRASWKTRASAHLSLSLLPTPLPLSFLHVCLLLLKTLMTTLDPYRSETVCSSQHPIPKPICKVSWGTHSLSSHWGPSCATWGHAHGVAGRGTEHLQSLGLAFHGDGTYGPFLQKRTPPYPINPFLWPAQSDIWKIWPPETKWEPTHPFLWMSAQDTNNH